MRAIRTGQYACTYKTALRSRMRLRGAAEGQRPRLRPCCMIRNRPPRNRTADVLDDFLMLFRRRPFAGRRRRSATVDSRWGINLETLGGWIGLGRADRIPRTGPSMRPRQNRDEASDWQPAPSYAQHPGSPALPPDDDWQTAQYAQHAEPP